MYVLPGRDEIMWAKPQGVIEQQWAPEPQSVISDTSYRSWGVDGRFIGIYKFWNEAFGISRLMLTNIQSRKEGVYKMIENDTGWCRFETLL